VNEPGSSDAADPLYRPLGGPVLWETVAVDDDAWLGALRRLHEFRVRHPALADLALRGAGLAAAYQSAAMAGLHDGARGVAVALVSHGTFTDDVDGHVRHHVEAIDEAQRMATEAPAISEELILRVHGVACRHQVTHGVRVGHRVQDHVLAHGEYKHHPNHLQLPGGGWRPRAPVARVGPEATCLVGYLGSPVFGGLHPVVQAAYALHAVTHVAPFADGNGRVARVVSGAFLLRTAGIPLLVLPADARPYEDGMVAADGGDPAPLVDFVLRRAVDAAALTVDVAAPGFGETPKAALDRWHHEVRTARALAELLPDAVRRALDRHRARTDLGWLSPLADAEIVVPAPSSHEERFDAAALVVRVPPSGGPAVEEDLPIAAHPLGGDGGVVVLRARHAQLNFEVAVGWPGPELSARIEPWLDRVLSTLALRVAAAQE